MKIIVFKQHDTDQILKNITLWSSYLQERSKIRNLIKTEQNYNF